MNDISAFIPYVKEHVLNIKTNGKFGLAHSIARIDDAKQGSLSLEDEGCDIFKIALPFATIDITCEVLFINGVPDVILYDDRLLPEPSDLPTLCKWNSSSTLLDLFLELYEYIRRRQKEIIMQGDYPEYKQLYEIFQYENIELYVDLTNNVHLLLKLDIDFLKLPNYSEDNLLVCLLNIEKSKSKIILSPDAERCLTCKSFDIAGKQKLEQLVYHIMEAASEVQSKIDLIIRKFTKKKDIFNELAKANSLELVEMDERHLNKVTYRICNKNFASIIKIENDMISVVSIYDQLGLVPCERQYNKLKIDDSLPVKSNVKTILDYFKKITWSFTKEYNLF